VRRRPVILTVVGARPQFVKIGPLSREIRRVACEVLVHTGQHYDRDMSDAFFEELALPRPDHHLGVGSGSHGAMTARMLEGLERVMQEESPDLVLVLGDTNSTLAGALAAAKLHIPVAHVEAGLRSFDMRMPEEVNRRLTDHASTLLFTPTAAGVANLRAEGLTRGVHRVGDVMMDAVLQNRVRADARPRAAGAPPPGAYYLATLHRQENVDDKTRLRAIVGALSQLPAPVVLPLHPRTRARVEAHGVRLRGSIEACGPASYLDMLRLVGEARAVLTDSGGVQKEAFILGTPCITLRDSTEWVETVAAGANTLVGADPGKIAAAVRRIGERRARARAGARRAYGDGDASARIAAILRLYLARA
jgi:UDP-N-acetylglucosamine 2-epimerase